MARHLPLRTATAAQLQQALAEVFRKYGTLSAEKIPWQQLEMEVEAVMQREAAAAFALLFIAAVDDDPGLGLLLPSAGVQGEAAALAYGAQRGRLVSSPLIRNLQDAVARGRGLADVATVARAEGIAITEVTRTVTAAEDTAYGLGRKAAGLQGQQDGVWHIDPMVANCPVCVDLDGTHRAVWGLQFPAGPPDPHPKCQCWIEWVPLAVKNPAE